MFKKFETERPNHITGIEKKYLMNFIGNILATVFVFVLFIIFLVMCKAAWFGFIPILAWILNNKSIPDGCFVEFGKFILCLFVLMSTAYWMDVQAIKSKEENK